MTDVECIWNKETVQFENGIDVKNIRKHLRVREKNIIRIIAVSYEWAVHGYDRLLNGLLDYYKNKNNKYEIYVLFVGTVMNSTRELIKKNGLEKYVSLPGVKSGPELDDLYDISDIGMGCMALHRRARDAVSDLKTREYVAKGIPYIYSGNQLGEDSNFKYSLKMEEGDDGLDIEEIIKFYETFKDNSNVADEIRNWAKQCSWEKQMEKIFV